MDHRKTIYLVDDDEDDCELMQEALIDAVEHVHVVQVRHAFDLVRMLDTDRNPGIARLILLDINMPVMNGFELLEIIKPNRAMRTYQL